MAALQWKRRKSKWSWGFAVLLLVVLFWLSGGPALVQQWFS